MSTIESIYAKAKADRQRICVPECMNEIMMLAASKVQKERIRPREGGDQT